MNEASEAPTGEGLKKKALPNRNQMTRPCFEGVLETLLASVEARVQFLGTDLEDGELWNPAMQEFFASPTGSLFKSYSGRDRPHREFKKYVTTRVWPILFESASEKKKKNQICNQVEQIACNQFTNWQGAMEASRIKKKDAAEKKRLASDTTHAQNVSTEDILGLLPQARRQSLVTPPVNLSKRRRTFPSSVNPSGHQLFAAAGKGITINGRSHDHVNDLNRLNESIQSSFNAVVNNYMMPPKHLQTLMIKQEATSRILANIKNLREEQQLASSNDLKDVYKRMIKSSQNDLLKLDDDENKENQEKKIETLEVLDSSDSSLDL